MYDLDFVKVNKTLVKGLRMIGAVRRLAKDVGLDVPELALLEREVREAAADVQRAEKVAQAECR